MNHFAVLYISYAHSPTSTIVEIKTNLPCHLTCYHTDKTPLRHKTSRTERGLTLPWGAYFCFVSWEAVEQQEAGDTTTHTFEIAPWLYCQTKFLAFRGTFAGILSPSTSPIFEHHYYGVLFQHYNTGESSAYRFATTTWVAQTFTVEIPHFINQVTLMLNRTGSPGTVVVGIWPTDLEGHPTGDEMTSATFDGNDLILFPGKEWKAISLDRYHLTAAKYAIVLRAPDSTPGNSIGWWGDTISPTYITGNFERGRSPGRNWAAILTRDAMFEEWGTYA